MSVAVPADLAARLDAFGQKHVLRWWDELSDAERTRLLGQLQEIDFEEIARLWRKARGDGPSDQAGQPDASHADRTRRARPPADLVRLARSDADRRERAAAVQRGSELIAAGKAGVILVAGGEGTRLRFPHPKGMFPIGPVTGRTLFQWLAGQIAVCCRRAGVRIPLYVMTSDATHEKTVRYFDENGGLGLREEDVAFFRQGTMPVVHLADGRLLMASRGEIGAGPDGHGGLVDALAAHGLIDDMARRGIEYLFYVQVDNPTAKVCDPAFLGYHVLHGSELSTKVVAKNSAGEKMGVLCDVDGRTEIIEYSDFPLDAAAMTDAAGGFVHWAGNTAMHVFSRRLLERLVSGAGALPFHIAKKHVKYVDDSGELVDPKGPGKENACKFEKFIFDALPVAQHTLVVEADRRREFNPLKDFEGGNSPEAVRAALRALFAGWLRRAGIDVPAGTAVEISPEVAFEEEELVAIGSEALAARLQRRPEGWLVG